MPSALRLPLRPSIRLALLVVALYGTGLVLTTLLPLPLWALVLIAIAVLASARQALNKALLRCGKSPGVLSLDASGLWLLVLRNGDELPAKLVYSFAHPWLITLCFRYGAHGRSCLALLPDALSEDDMHALRLRLRSL
jgi:hypothetical protein